MARHRKLQDPSRDVSAGGAIGPRARELLGVFAAMAWLHSGRGMNAVDTLTIAVAAYPDTSAYIRACSAGTGGLPVRILADLSPSTRPGAVEVEGFWNDVFPREASLISDPHIAFGFVDVICDVWRQWRAFSGCASFESGLLAARLAHGAEKVDQ